MRSASPDKPPRSLLQRVDRRSGRFISLPLVLTRYDGEPCLGAMLGEDVNWVRNVRAADGRAVLLHGRREAVRLEEVEPGRRAPVLRRFVELVPGARAHLPVDWTAPVSEFERIAADYAVVRIVPDLSATP